MDEMSGWCRGAGSENREVFDSYRPMIAVAVRSSEKLTLSDTVGCSRTSLARAGNLLRFQRGQRLSERLDRNWLRHMARKSTG